MGDLNNDSNVLGTWPVYYGDKPSSNGQFHDPQIQMRIADAYFGYRTNVRQKMLEHEAIFKTQLYELHRVYRVQKELMDDMKMNELQKQSMAITTPWPSCSASLPFLLASSSSAQLGGGGKDFHSVPDFLNGRHSQNNVISPTNTGSSKKCEVEILECRPSTASTKKLDLELQADEYINVEESKYRTLKPSGMSHHNSKWSCEIPTSSSTKIFLSQSQSFKIDCRGDQTRQNKGILADLDQQVQSQGLSSSSPNFVGRNSNFRSHQQLCSKSQLQTSPWDSMPNSHFVCDASGSNNLTMAHKDNGRDWSHISNSVCTEGQTTSFSHYLLPENIDFFSKDRNASHFQTNQIKADYQSKERFEGGPRNYGNNSFNHLGDSHLGRSFSISKEGWEKPSTSETQKLVTPYPFFNSTSMLSQSLQSRHIIEGSGLNLVYQNELYKGSGSRSRPGCRPVIGYSYFDRSNEPYMASGANVYQNGSVKFKGLPCADASSTKGIDLNITSIADKHDYDDRPNQDHVAHLPWTKSSTTAKTNMGLNTEPASSAYDMTMKDTASKTIMGVPVFGDYSTSKSSLSRRSSLSEEEKERNGRVRGFDINLPCEYAEKDIETHVVSNRNLIDLNMCLTDNDEVIEILTPCSHTGKTIRGFDLEASIEDEDMIQPKQQESENSAESLVTAAAEVLYGISPCMKQTVADTSQNLAEKTKSDTLKWFVDIVSIFPDDVDNVSQEKCDEDSDSVDYFECMTLKLTEIKEEDHLPNYPKVPEPEEETGTGLYTTRTRKGQARRGRPRRDFQRDIMPGLTSLARHEVTEDLQTFGGLMRAAGHSWQSSLTRRTGAKRGRPRLTPVQPPILVPTPNLSYSSCSHLAPKKPPSPFCPALQKRKATYKEFINMEEDQGNLAGWEKTTRRPRRHPRRQLYSTA